MDEPGRINDDCKRIERFHRSLLSRARAYLFYRKVQPIPFALVKAKAQPSAEAMSLLHRIASGDAIGEPIEWTSLASALEVATRENAYETAEALARFAVPRLHDCPQTLLRPVLRRVVDSLVACGDNDQASSVIAKYSRDLPKVGYSPELFLRQGVAKVEGLTDAHAVYRALREGTLPINAFVDLLYQQRQRMLTNPRLELALFFAYRTLGLPFQMAPLNRYLRAEGLPPLQCDVTRSGNVLASFSCGSERKSVVARDGAPRVSIICSAYRAEATLGYAVRSLLAQTYESIEILLCDDQSDDRTFAIASQLAAKDRRIRLFQSVTNQGTYNVRNSLIPYARGTHVTFHDADDYSLPWRIERQLTAMDRTGAKLCVANWMRVLENGLFVSFRDGKEKRLSVVSLMADRQLLLSHLPYRSARHSADLEMYEKLVAAAGVDKLVRVSAPLIFGLWSDQSLTRARGSEAFENGYRAESRRHYAELCFRQRLLGKTAVEDSFIDDELRASGNYFEPKGVVEVKPPEPDL